MRNTKTSIKEEYQIPDCCEELILIDPHPLEAALLANAQMNDKTGKRIREREICDHPLLVAKYAKYFEDTQSRWSFASMQKMIVTKIKVIRSFSEF